MNNGARKLLRDEIKSACVLSPATIRPNDWLLIGTPKPSAKEESLHLLRTFPGTHTR
jgi:hypothetical protein